MTPAEELTAAADKLDALVAEATAGPWTLSKAGASTKQAGRIIGIDGGPAGYDEVVRAGDVRCGSYCYGGSSVIDAADADWRYIAAMNPLVGKALADLLRRFEAACERDAGRARDLSSTRGARVDDRIPGLTLALDLARLINGSES